RASSLLSNLAANLQPGASSISPRSTRGQESGGGIRWRPSSHLIADAYATHFLPLQRVPTPQNDGPPAPHFLTSHGYTLFLSNCGCGRVARVVVSGGFSDSALMLAPLLGYFFCMITVLTAAAVLLTGFVNISPSRKESQHLRPPAIGQTVMVETQRHSPPAAK